MSLNPRPLPSAGTVTLANPTYTNPILDADWPDPDVIRWGDGYVLVASSFNRSPGLPVLVSDDLVNWSIVSHALAVVPPASHFSLPRHGQGVWAPSIRLHDGLLRIYYPDPDRGIYVVTAPGPEGPWSEPVAVLEGLGLIDPCPLFDIDPDTGTGAVYLVHGWAASRSGRKNVLTVVELDSTGTQPVGVPRSVIDGDELPGYTTLEGPKFYAANGWYWIFAPAGGVATGWQSAFRSRSPWGPYEARIVLEQGESTINGPHQGAWVTAPDGSDWFVHFQDTGVFGRVVHLQPIQWDDDGWPCMGERRAGRPDLPGMAVATAASPAGGLPQGTSSPARSDDFTRTELSLQWHWQANPRQEQLRLDGDGFLRLRALANDHGNLRTLPQVLSQQLPSSATTVTTHVELVRSTGGARAGVVLLGTEYAWLGLVHEGGRVRVSGGLGPRGRGDSPLVDAADVRPDEPVELRLQSRGDGRVDFAWRQGEDPWTQAITPFRARQGTWIGAEIGLFAASPVGSAEPGEALFGRIDIRPAEVFDTHRIEARP